MKRKSNKKGFTIVELVIVIAVIAILSAVMIPTFVGVVRRARLSSDESAVTHMNKAITMVSVENEPKTLDELIDALVEEGFNADDTLVPLSKDHEYYWFYQAGKYNMVVLVNENDEVVYPKNETLAADFAAAADTDKYCLRGADIYVDVEASDRETLEKALRNGNENITLKSNIVLKKEVTVAENSNITIDLNGKSLDASKMQSRPFVMAENSNLTINATGANVKVAEYGLVNIPSGATNVNVTLKGGNYTADLDNGAFIKVRPGSDNVTVTLENVNYTDVSDDSYVVNTNGFSGKFTLNIKGGSYKAAAGFQMLGGTIENATIETSSYALLIHGDATVKGCTIKTGDKQLPNDDTPAIAVAVATKGTVEVSNTTITTQGTAYAVVNTGGTLIATNNTVNATTLYTKYPLDAGVTVSVLKIDGVEQA